LNRKAPIRPRTKANYRANLLSNSDIALIIYYRLSVPSKTVLSRTWNDSDPSRNLLLRIDVGSPSSLSHRFGRWWFTMAGVFASRKDRVCTDLIAVHEGLLASVQARREYARSWTDLGKTASGMASLQIPPLKDQFTKLSELFNDAAQIHLKLADAEDRNADDFRDVFERFDVVFRYNDQYNDAKIKYAEATNELAQIRDRIAVEKELPSWGKVEMKYTQQEGIAKANRIAALDRYKQQVALLLNAQQAYIKFKVRQFSHGWKLYAAALKEASEAELDVFARIKEHLQGLSLDGPEGALQLAATAQLAASPVEAIPQEVIDAPDGLQQPAAEDPAYD
jgi:hypothetical protein